MTSLLLQIKKIGELGRLLTRWTKYMAKHRNQDYRATKYILREFRCQNFWKLLPYKVRCQEKKTMMAILDKKGRKMKKKFTYKYNGEDYYCCTKRVGNGNRKKSTAFFSMPTMQCSILWWYGTGCKRVSNGSRRRLTFV